MILLHVEQWLPSVSPSSVHVASFLWATTIVCPEEEITSCFLMTSWHVEQWLPSVIPSSVHVAAFPWSTTIVCPEAGSISVLVWFLNILFLNSTVYVILPFVVHVGGITVFWVIVVSSSICSAWFKQTLLAVTAVLSVFHI